MLKVECRGSFQIGGVLPKVLGSRGTKLGSNLGRVIFSPKTSRTEPKYAKKVIIFDNFISTLWLAVILDPELKISKTPIFTLKHGFTVIPDKKEGFSDSFCLVGPRSLGSLLAKNMVF